MTYVEITDDEVSSGKPVKNELTDKIKDNFIDHEDRIADLESGANVDYPPIILTVGGFYENLLTAEKVGYLKTTANFSFRITGVRLIIDKAGTSGTTQIDLLIKSGVGSYTTIFTTKPSVLYSAGNDATSSNAVIDAGNDEVAAGDFIRLDITSVQALGDSFMVRIDYERI